jgi:hypothetical protein
MIKELGKLGIHGRTLKHSIQQVVGWCHCRKHVWDLRVIQQGMITILILCKGQLEASYGSTHGKYVFQT